MEKTKATRGAKPLPTPISKHELEYTPEEKDRIGKLEGKCAGYMAKGMKEGVFDKVKAFGNELKGILKGILNAVTE